MKDPINSRGYHTTVSTSNGNYYVGMTRSKAEQNDSYSAKIGIDFKDLDTNNDEVLSQKEILEGRVSAAKRDGAAYIASGLTTTIAGGIVSIGTFGLGLPMIMGGNGFAAYGVDMIKSATEELERYNNDREAQRDDARRFDTKG